MNPRFNPDCNTFDEVLEYYMKRALQLKRSGIYFIEIRELEYGAVAFFIDPRQNLKHYSLYLYKDYRGQGLFGKFDVKQYIPKGFEDCNFTLITSDDCDLDSYLLSKGISARIIKFNSLIANAPYKLISEFYGAGKASRSGVDFMNHIDEAYAILHLFDFNKSYSVIRAYCLHPIVQMDSDLLKTSQKMHQFEPTNIFLEDIMYAMEYRSVANEYLSNRKINSIEEIRLSPLQVVNDMLILDKIQNRKDFDLYHKGKHERSDELAEYFDNWFRRLGITEEMYQKCLSSLKIEPAIYKI